MEVLVWCSPGSEDVVVDPPERHQAKDQVRGRRVSPGTPIHQETALRIRIERADLLKEAREVFLSTIVCAARARENQRYWDVPIPQRLKRGQPGVARCLRLDVVVGTIAAPQLLSDQVTGASVGLDD